MSAFPPAVICATCGKAHPLAETEITYGLPDDIYSLPEHERLERAKTSSDICMLDSSRMYLRCLLPIPVLGRNWPYRIGVWVEVSSSDFQEIYALWDDRLQSSHAPFAGRLANEVFGWPGSCGLVVDVQLSGPDTRPELSVRDTSHGLHMEQRHGITEHRALEYSSWRDVADVV